MSGHLRYGALLALLLFTTTGARAAGLWEATWFQVTQGVPMTRTFAELGASGGIFNSGASIGVWLSYPRFTTTLFVPRSPNGTLDLGYRITQSGPQQIIATAGMATATPGVPGSVVLKTAAHIGMGVDRSMFMLGNVTLLQIPLNHGKAGQFTDTHTILPGFTVHVTVDFFAWTPGSVLFTGLTSNGVPLPDASAMGSWHLDGLDQGLVTLVSPSKVSIDGPIQRRTVSFTTLHLEFPEPEAWLLLGAAGSALAFCARRRPGAPG